MVHDMPAAAESAVCDRTHETNRIDSGNIEAVQQGLEFNDWVHAAAASYASADAATDHSCTDANFTIRLVASGPVDGELDMLPEVIKLMELHRSLMAS